MSRFIIFFLTAIFFSLSLTTALSAQETQPGEPCSTNGAMRDTGGPEQIPRRILICNGVAWQTLMEQATTGKSLLQIGYDEGACTTSKAGRQRFNGTDRWEYCNGSAWVPFEQSGSGNLSGPEDCPTIGDQCTTSGEGIIFAGWNPITHERLFIPPTDQANAVQWKISSGIDDIDPDSYYDGRSNHTNRSGLISDFPAFKACEDFIFAGKNNWYLPSRIELYYLWSVQAALEQKNNITPFTSGNYWSSSEHTVSGARSQSFPGGSQDNKTKSSYMYAVRCLWRA